MIDRSQEVAEAMDRFPIALDAAGWMEPLPDERFHFTYDPVPHPYPRRLRTEFAAVYAFHDEIGWLKVGKAGPGSDNRFRYQHYSPGSAASTLATSLLTASWFLSQDENRREEILGRTGRLNVFVHRSFGEFFLGFLESFLILRFQPRFEGHRWG